VEDIQQMRYAKISTPEGALYVAVEEREGALWATGPIAAPEEDPLPSAHPAVHFRPAPLDSFTLCAPVNPSKILCVGRNYRDHATELGNDIPTEPLLFLKAPSSLLAPNGTVLMPALSKRIDFEGELAIVIGKRCRSIGPDEDVRPYIRGYTLVNDVTARDIQKSDGQWTRGKGWDTFCPAGPIVSSEIDPITTPVTITTHLNGVLKQTGTTADFIFDIPHLMRYITAFTTLNPGDLIPTGTPAGVGPMQAGDVVEVTIPGLGVLRNHLAAE
jgi:2-keto-4-pentenoate hydratase/2-oxohepta-3-ene-1,7-dioic acid hydratase in catechol pathway